MALVTKRELRQLMQMHYILEIILALAYLLLKKIPWIATRVFETSEFQAVETELLIFTLILIVFKNKRRGHLNFLPYLSSACTMAKIGNSLLFFYAKPAYAFTYLSCNIAHYILFPKPKYKGPERITYFLGDDFEKELAKDKSISWLIEFYESWNPDCNEFAGVFSELSAKFGKIDVSRSSKVAEKYSIVSSITSRTLPTLILFKNGREEMRRPLMDSRGRVIPFSFSYKNSSRLVICCCHVILPLVLAFVYLHSPARIKYYVLVTLYRMSMESVSQDKTATRSIGDDEIFEVHLDGNEIPESSPTSICSIQAYNETEKPIIRLSPHNNGDRDYTEPAQTCVQTVDDILIGGDHQGVVSSELEEYGDNLVAQIINNILEQF